MYNLFFKLTTTERSPEEEWWLVKQDLSEAIVKNHLNKHLPVDRSKIIYISEDVVDFNNQRKYNKQEFNDLVILSLKNNLESSEPMGEGQVAKPEPLAEQSELKEPVKKNNNQSENKQKKNENISKSDQVKDQKENSKESNSNNNQQYNPKEKDSNNDLMSQPIIPIIVNNNNKTKKRKDNKEPIDDQYIILETPYDPNGDINFQCRSGWINRWLKDNPDYDPRGVMEKWGNNQPEWSNDLIRGACAWNIPWLVKKCLLDSRINPHVRVNECLREAARKKFHDIVEMLLKAQVKDTNGWAMTCARQNKDQKMIALLSADWSDYQSVVVEDPIDFVNHQMKKLIYKKDFHKLKFAKKPYIHKPMVIHEGRAYHADYFSWIKSLPIEQQSKYFLKKNTFSQKV